MALFSKKRSDGELVRDGDPINLFMPYIMKGRNESAVYYRMKINVAKSKAFINKYRKDNVRISQLDIIVAAMLQTIFLRPRSNRFIVGRRVYQRKNFEVLLVVKESLTDESYESVAKISFDRGDNIFDVARKMDEQIQNIRDGKMKTDDKLVEFLTKTPRWFNRLLLNLVRILDFHNILPKALRESLPFYSSIFISHLGSIGADAPYHHLYEFGTTSIFMTVGRIYEVPKRARDNSLEWEKVIDLAFTIDERICDGYYLVKTLKTFEDFMNNPEKLTEALVEEIVDDEVSERRQHLKKFTQFFFKDRRK